MKRTRSKKTSVSNDDLLPEYHLDYSKGRRNPYASLFARDQIMVVLDEDLSKVFRSPSAVNKALRKDLSRFPEKVSRRRSQRPAPTRQL